MDVGEGRGPFERRGNNYALWNVDVLAPDVLHQSRLFEKDVTESGRSTRFDPYYTTIPFFYHARKNDRFATAGFFIDNGYKGNVEFGRDELRARFDGGQYTEYVFAGPSLRAVLEAYTFVTGRMPLPPLWSLGHHQCRWHDYDAERLVALGQRYRERGIPCDSLWLDIGYMDGYRVYTWNKERFHDVPKMMKDAEAGGFKVITIVDPGVKFDPGYSVFEEGRAKGVFCKTEAGKLYVGQVWPGRTVFPDFALEKTRSFWADLTVKHLSQGIAGIWNDMNEPSNFDGGNTTVSRAHTARGDFWRDFNLFGYGMAQASRESWQSSAPGRR